MIEAGRAFAERGLASPQLKSADHRMAPQIAFRPDRAKHAAAAPFTRNDAMIEAPPIAIMVFPGAGIWDGLADKAKKTGVPCAAFAQDLCDTGPEGWQKAGAM
jgi:hypothetical protein